MENWLLNLIWVYLLAVNTLAFSLMGIDKRRAKRGAWRIAERTLFLPVVLFGSLGGTLGMFCFHHNEALVFSLWLPDSAGGAVAAAGSGSVFAVEVKQ